MSCFFLDGSWRDPESRCDGSPRMHALCVCWCSKKLASPTQGGDGPPAWLFLSSSHVTSTRSHPHNQGVQLAHSHWARNLGEMPRKEAPTSILITDDVMTLFLATSSYSKGKPLSSRIFPKDWYMLNPWHSGLHTGHPTQFTGVLFGCRKVENSKEERWQRVRVLKVRAFPEQQLYTTPFIS